MIVRESQDLLPCPWVTSVEELDICDGIGTALAHVGAQFKNAAPDSFKASLQELVIRSRFAPYEPSTLLRGINLVALRKLVVSWRTHVALPRPGGESQCGDDEFTQTVTCHASDDRGCRYYLWQRESFLP